MKIIPIKVESYSGHKADEYPKSFYWNDKKFEIVEITDRWYQSDPDADWAVSNYFKVRTTTDMLCLIKHVIEFEMWYLVKVW